MTYTEKALRPLLDFIAKPESNGNYNAVWGGISSRHRPPKPLTSMTIQQVLDWQDSIDPFYGSEAAGRYQFMEDTLRGLYRSVGCGSSDIFDEGTQDRLAIGLLKRRGLDQYMAGRITADKFCNSLAMEWASLPVVTDVIRRSGSRTWTVKAGSSYYSGDGLNTHGVSVSDFRAAVLAIRGQFPSQGHSDGLASLIAAIIDFLKQLFGANK